MNNKNKIENHLHVCAPSVFHQLLCRSLVRHDSSFVRHGCTGCCRCANLAFMSVYLECHLNYPTKSLATIWDRFISFVNCISSLFDIVLKFSVTHYCAFLCVELNLDPFLSLPTFLFYIGNFRFHLNLIICLVYSVANIVLRLIILLF